MFTPMLLKRRPRIFRPNACAITELSDAIVGVFVQRRAALVEDFESSHQFAYRGAVSVQEADLVFTGHVVGTFRQQQQ